MLADYNWLLSQRISEWVTERASAIKSKCRRRKRNAKNDDFNYTTKREVDTHRRIGETKWIEHNLKLSLLNN